MEENGDAEAVSKTPLMSACNSGEKLDSAGEGAGFTIKSDIVATV